ncbi:MAG: Re/Si-specific NAD(P)(+) transhydrogenase subunit alpha [Alphaproteobacteria bacterium]|nr:Re/Si-specific NAD(P)(+) transhydrogenase subunit alpha [Alphaproteobacteria bacterium]
MKVAIVKERRAFERRVAASPDTVKQMKGMGLDVAVEAGAGGGAFFVDTAYEAAGATIAADAAAALDGADIVLKVQRPLLGDGAELDELKPIKKSAVLVGLLSPLEHAADVQAYADAGLTAMAMELVPRITRAQTMDVLSSQANLAGYKAMVDAAGEFGRALPMMMTAAGTIKAARVLVMGAGVAGLQAIATARRLGAVVFATDVRAAAKEQVESLGASFLTVDADAMKNAETAAGYAREMGEDFQRRQRQMITDALRRIDIVICTALIPGRRAPVLLTAEMLDALAPGSVVADIAVESGGNVEGSKPEETVTTAGGVKIIGYANAPAHIAVDASLLYARNVAAFLALLVDKDKGLHIDTGDEIVKGALLTMDGAVVNPALAPAPPSAPAAGGADGTPPPPAAAAAAEPN